MSTSLADGKCRRSDSGVTVVELLVAVVIVGLLALLVSVPVQMTTRLSKTTLDQATEIMDSNLALRSIAKQLGSSQITRAKVINSNVIKCSGNSAVLTTDKDKSFSIPVPADGSELPKEVRGFTIPYSAGSSIGAISTTNTNAIHVTDANYFQRGDFITVISSETSNNIGIFQVTNVAEIDGKWTLSVGPADFSGMDSECKVDTSTLTSMAQFTAIIKSAGQASVFVQSLAFAIYDLQGRKLRMMSFPRSKEFNFVAFENVDRISITARWYDADKDGVSRDDVHSDGTVTTETNGSYLARVDVDLMETSLIPKYDAQGNLIPNRDKKSSSTYARYVMTSTKKMNDKAVTNARPQRELFPTCFLAAEASGFSPDDVTSGLTDRENRVILKMGVSDINGQYKMDVSYNSSKNGNVDCVNLSDVARWKASKAAGTPLAKPRIFKNSDFQLTGNSLSVDQAFCTVSGSVTFTGTVPVYDERLGRNITVKCKETVGLGTEAQLKYKIDATVPPACNQNGSCALGMLVRSDGKDSVIPKAQCTWAGANGATMPTSCCDGKQSGEPGMILSAIRLVAPEGILMESTKGLDIKCKP